ncbi:MAG: hypothetical protein Q9217_003261 [Psora testacea]
MGDRLVKDGAVKSRTSTTSPPVRPFQCQWHEGCSKSSSLARHRRIHTNDKPYICKNPQCRKAFCRKTTMTKHFRKEHPTESIDQEEDADYSEAEPSDDEPSLEQEAEDSADSLDFCRDGSIKSEAPSNAAASNYNANLWRLPAQTAQRPYLSQMQMSSDMASDITAQTVKLERSLSRTPQRTLTDPALNKQMTSIGYMQARANTLPGGMQRGAPTSFAAWQSQQMPESPTSMTSPQDYQFQGITVPASAPPQFSQSQAVPMSQPPLQSVHDIVLEDPQQSQYTQAPQQDFPPSQYTQTHHDFRDEMPRTPAPSQQIAYTASMDSAAPYQAPEFLTQDYNTVVAGTYTLPQQAGISIYNDPLDVYKEFKIEDTWGQMPDQAIRW